MDKRPIAILGGTFDPIHHGHLRPALELLEELNLAEVRFIPNALPPHRRQPAASSAQRLAMVERAIAGQPGFALDDREFKRAGPSYTVDTLTELRAELGPQRPLCLVVGRDAFLGLPTWHQWRRLLELTHIVVMERPGHATPEFEEPLAAVVEARAVRTAAAIAEAPAGRVLFWPTRVLDISSTQVRALLAQGRSPRYLLPDSVWDYIRAHDLYRGAA
ncbi:MAG TPA: nicotinate-nucleotide adenylyltransferase [Candidatus Competibacteraceae bacterium]|nr:nicotinate-nucleotide adenylyltransferase [Candidatus Competibacteraceae bacterium]